MDPVNIFFMALNPVTKSLIIRERSFRALSMSFVADTTVALTARIIPSLASRATSVDPFKAAFSKQIYVPKNNSMKNNANCLITLSVKIIDTIPAASNVCKLSTII